MIFEDDSFLYCETIETEAFKVLELLAKFERASSQKGINGRRQSTNNYCFWRKFWQIKIHPKVKNLVCRAIKNCLPTMSNLQRRLVHVDEVWSQRKSQANWVVKNAISYLDNWTNALDDEGNHRTATELDNTVVMRWTKPEVGTIKINRFGFGWLARDHEGRLLKLLRIIALVG